MTNFKTPPNPFRVDDINVWSHILKKHGENINNPSVRIYVNKIENRITFKTKTGCSLEL